MRGQLSWSPGELSGQKTYLFDFGSLRLLNEFNWVAHPPRRGLVVFPSTTVAPHPNLLVLFPEVGVWGGPEGCPSDHGGDGEWVGPSFDGTR